MESTVRGFESMARGRPEEAALCWLEADAGRPVVDSPFDPLGAASRANAAAAYLLRNDGQEAERSFDAADQAWQGVIVGIATLDVPMTGASSAFHFRLAAKVPHILIDARRDRYRHLARSAAAITQFNRALAADRNFTSATIAERASELSVTLSGTSGSASPEVRLLSFCFEPRPRADAYAVCADKHSEIASRQPTFAAALSEACAQLESAITLTALLVPPLFEATDGSPGNKANTTTDRHHQLEHE